MIVQRTTKVFLDPVRDFDNYTKLLRDDRWHRTLMSSFLAIFERNERVFEVAIDDLTRKEQ